MSYAIRNDKQGWRSVASEKDVKEGEFYSEVEPEINPANLIKTREQVEISRLWAYSHPVTGSDRFKAEADAERLAGNENAAIKAEQSLLDRRQQIKSENPWPIEE